MNARELIALQLTHRFASELSRALADSAMTINEFAAEVGESPSFIRRVLQGEDHLAKRLNMDLLAGVICATKQWVSISGGFPPPVKKDGAVKSGAA